MWRGRPGCGRGCPLPHQGVFAFLEFKISDLVQTVLEVLKYCLSPNYEENTRSQTAFLVFFLLLLLSAPVGTDRFRPTDFHRLSQGINNYLPFIYLLFPTIFSLPSFFSFFYFYFLFYFLFLFFPFFFSFLLIPFFPFLFFFYYLDCKEHFSHFFILLQLRVILTVALFLDQSVHSYIKAMKGMHCYISWKIHFPYKFLKINL